MNIHGDYPADVMLDINSKMKGFMNPDTGTWDGSYPKRMLGWIEFVVELLRFDPDSRRAVVPIYGSPDLNAKSLDICCTLNLQFLLRDGKLNLIVTMRSNDALLGLANDVVQFAFVQKVIASCLGVPTGWYSHRAGSMHIYERDMEKVSAIIADEGKLDKRFPEFPEDMWFGGAKQMTSVIVDRYREFMAGTKPEDLNYWFSKPWQDVWKVMTKQV